MKKIYLLFLPFFIFSQDCYDDNYTMQVGLSVWTSGIVGCEDGISFLEDAGYPCNTPLSTLNNPFWGTNPNETLFNICSCTCEKQSPNFCEDSAACNYGEVGECEYIEPNECDCEGNTPEFGYDCNDDCLNDNDGDGICDDFEVSGCTDPTACNFDENATDDDNSCTYPDDIYLDCYGNCINDADGDGICDEFEVNGCTDSTACNFDENATDDDNSCTYPDEIYLDCYGNCINDYDEDGICDQFEEYSCDQYPDPGPCFAAIEIFYFNQETDLCESFIWGGCAGVVPFETLIDCQNQCQNNTSINEKNNDKKLIKSINILGKTDSLNKLTLILYNDGSVEKIYKY